MAVSSHAITTGCNSDAAAATAASERLIRKQGCTNERDGSQGDDSITRHGSYSL
jgi:hypothetical protein